MLNSCNKHEGVYIWEGDSLCSVCRLVEQYQELSEENLELKFHMENNNADQETKFYRKPD